MFCSSFIGSTSLVSMTICTEVFDVAKMLLVKVQVHGCRVYFHGLSLLLSNEFPILILDAVDDVEVEQVFNTVKPI